MAIRFHLDEHVDLEVAERLRRVGIDVTTTDDAGLKGAEDPDHLRFASSQGRVTVTNDRDFLRLHSRGFPHVGIAFYPDQDRPAKRIAEVLITMHGAMGPEQMHSRVEYI